VAGQPADFSAKVDAPSAIDYLLASLASCLVVGFKALASKRNVEIDDAELTLKGSLDNILYHMEIEDEGSPKISKILGTFYVSSPHEEEQVEEIWRDTLKRSPIYQTLIETVQIDIKLSVVF
jgi:uncharacterized OsmC-like protein